MTVMPLLAWLAEAEQPSMRSHLGNLLFTGIFILAALLAGIWWMKRNYM